LPFSEPRPKMINFPNIPYNDAWNVLSSKVLLASLSLKINYFRFLWWVESHSNKREWKDEFVQVFEKDFVFVSRFVRTKKISLYSIEQCFSFHVSADDEIIFRKIFTIRYLFRLYFRFVWKQYPSSSLTFFRVQRTTRQHGGVTWIFFYPSQLFGLFCSPNGIFVERQVAF
jgi:hypothetical protein